MFYYIFAQVVVFISNLSACPVDVSATSWGVHGQARGQAVSPASTATTHETKPPKQPG